MVTKLFYNISTYIWNNASIDSIINASDIEHMSSLIWFDFIECFTTTFLRAHSWLNWVGTYV